MSATLIDAAAPVDQDVDIIPAATPIQTAADPLPMSFPAILRNPGLRNDRFAHLRPISEDGQAPLPPSKKAKRDEKGGKRWIRRDENARFVGNPHIVRASRKDYSLPVPSARSTFPEPLPSCLPRIVAIPPAVLPAREPRSANAGRFSLSLKGMRRELRHAGPRTEQLVRDIEGEITAWLRAGGVLLTPDGPAAGALGLPGTPVGRTGAIREVARTPLQLVWSIADDAYARYVVHCCARYHEIVSFSKESAGQRLTYLLRPNVTRPDHHAASLLDTPPATDLSAHEVESESDFIPSEYTDSDLELFSDAERERARTRRLSAISETASLAGAPPRAGSLADDEEWSVIGENDGDGDSESGLVESVQSLTLSEGVEHTPRPMPLRQRALRSPGWQGRQGRSASSPSRSPARRMPRRSAAKSLRGSQDRSFYDYLFS